MLIDFQEASANLPTFDLGFLLSFFPPVNQTDTVAFLKKYHAYLDAKIIDQYPFSDLMDDYRLMLCQLLYVPVWDQSYGAPEIYWKPKFKNVMRDFQNFECMDFLQSLNRSESTK
jgi:thiamine kinase-like enzyme